MSISRILRTIPVVAGCVCFFLMFTVIYAGDKRPLPIVNTTDFVSTLYVGGHMVSHGAGQDLYPRPNAADFYAEKFSAYAHRLLPRPDKKWLDLFTYPPVVALLVAPLAMLSPVAALVLWQVISFLSLALAAFLFASTKAVHASTLKVLMCSCLFLPILNVFVIGQTSLVFGVLPLAAGYFFWQRRQYFFAGLAWSILGLKPQLALSVAIIVVSLFLSSFVLKTSQIARREPSSIAAGLIAGTFVLHLIPTLVLGFGSLMLWLNAVKMSGNSFGAKEIGYWQYHLFFSLPCLLVLVLPKACWQAARLPSYLIGVAMILLGVFVSCRIGMLGFAAERRRDLLVVVTTPFVIASAPHLLLYDTCLLFLPAWILFFKLSNKSLLVRRARMGALIVLFAFDLYTCLLLGQSSNPTTLWQVLIVGGILAYTLLFFLHLPNAEDMQ